MRGYLCPPPPDIDRIVRVDHNELAFMDRRMGEVSVHIWTGIDSQ